MTITAAGQSGSCLSGGSSTDIAILQGFPKEGRTARKSYSAFATLYWTVRDREGARLVQNAPRKRLFLKGLD